jgi:hypothetical protein
MINDVQLLRDALDASENALAASWRRGGAAPALELLRTTDWLAANVAYPVLRWTPTLDMFHKGIALSLATALTDSEDGSIVIASDGNPTWAERALVEFGSISHLRRVAQLADLGLMRVQRVSSTMFEVSTCLQDAEKMDRGLHEWFRRFAGRKDRLENRFARKIYPALRKAVASRTQRWIEHRIWYEFDEGIEDEFVNRAWLRIRGIPGADFFPEATRLGPLSLGQWRQQLVREVARRLRHIESVRALASRYKDFDGRLAITEIVSASDVAERWAHYLGCEFDIAGEAVGVLSLGASDFGRYCREMETPFPLFVRVRPGALFMPVYGALRDPIYCAWRQIRQAYPVDWDRAVASREAGWRLDLRQLLPPPRFIVQERGRLLRDGTRHRTDIDAIVIDTVTGALLLIQLKWQDMFGSSPKERRSRGSNFLREGSEWVETVNAWVAGRSSREIARALSLTSGNAAGNAAPLLFVLGRYAANFTIDQEYDRRAGWCSWLEFVRELDERRAEIDFQAFHSELIRRARFVRTDDPRPQRFIVSSLTVAPESWVVY